MKVLLQKVLMKSPLGYAIGKIVKYRKDIDYLNLVIGLQENPNVIELCPGHTEKDQIVCLVQAGGKNEGFFATIRWILDGLYYCDQYGFIPYVKFPENSLYKDRNMPEEQNPFDYYYEQPSQIDLRGRAYIRYTGRNARLAEQLNGGVSYEVSPEYIRIMGATMAKYLHFNDNTRDFIKAEMTKREVDESVLGVHIRGTDYKSNFRNHPVYIEPEDYYPYIDTAISEYNFSKIYLATDDSDILKEFIEHYGEERVIYAKDSIRGSSNVGVHTSEQNSCMFEHYRLGLEVICDMCALAECGGILSGMSQVGLNARIYKESQGEKFNYDKVINKGINKKGKVFSV